ncbi:hypothetical protein UPYG_G00141110 [Umbra pygmaea]|uniref:Uncharacterized protein n=1 Tax=Umbra pygmaea TaxID=75934 RepID=A0ABD0WZN0_UMBPY
MSSLSCCPPNEEVVCWKKKEALGQNSLIFEDEDMTVREHETIRMKSEEAGITVKEEEEDLEVKEENWIKSVRGEEGEAFRMERKAITMGDFCPFQVKEEGVETIKMKEEEDYLRITKQKPEATTLVKVKEEKNYLSEKLEEDVFGMNEENGSEQETEDVGDVINTRGYFEKPKQHPYADETEKCYPRSEHQMDLSSLPLGLKRMSVRLVDYRKKWRLSASAIAEEKKGVELMQQRERPNAEQPKTSQLESRHHCTDRCRQHTPDGTDAPPPPFLSSRTVVIYGTGSCTPLRGRLPHGPFSTPPDT